MSRKPRHRPAPTAPPASWIRHVIADISYRLERIDCACGVVVTAPAGQARHDAHGPLADAWMAHRAENYRHRKDRIPPGPEHVWKRGGPGAPSTDTP